MGVEGKRRSHPQWLLGDGVRVGVCESKSCLDTKVKGVWTSTGQCLDVHECKSGDW